LLRTGIKGKHVLALAQELLDGFGGVAGLLHTPPMPLNTPKVWDQPNAPSSWPCWSSRAAP
jgi:DNA repair protein RadC